MRVRQTKFMYLKKKKTRRKILVDLLSESWIVQEKYYRLNGNEIISIKNLLEIIGQKECKKRKTLRNENSNYWQKSMEKLGRTETPNSNIDVGNGKGAEVFLSIAASVNFHYCFLSFNLIASVKLS